MVLLTKHLVQAFLDVPALHSWLEEFEKGGRAPIMCYFNKVLLCDGMSFSSRKSSARHY
jgi:hypothetical protein